jgi:asparaginyl-tRNA synthetase
VELTKKEEQAAARDVVYPYSRSYGRANIATVLRAPDGGRGLVGATIRVGGWVKTGREAGAGAFCFLEVNDGSCFESLQVLVDKAVAEAAPAENASASAGGASAPAAPGSTNALKRLIPTGTCVLIEGELCATPEGTKQAVELKARKVLHVGSCDAASYPIAKKKTTMEFLRGVAHLRPRTNTVGAVARVRNALAYSTHEFFQSRGFLYVHTPVITASDCEGAGEMFQVTTMFAAEKERRSGAGGGGGAANGSAAAATAEDLPALREQVAAQGEKVKAAKAAAAADKADAALQATSKAEVDALLLLKKKLEQAEQAALWVGGFKRLPGGSGDVDFSDDFFGRPAFLTVSGQLQGEYYASALTNIYTFGPTFRAENSHTARHLAEFWMIEPEMAFCDLQDDMQCAEDYVRHCASHLLATCMPDLEFLAKMVDSTCIDRLKQVAATPFARCSYTDAIAVLEQAVASGAKKFDNAVSWGIDLATEHERFLAEEHFKGPVIVFDYPKEIKSFYMRANEDGKTVAAMDVLVPRVGELVGGSQREDRHSVLLARMAELGMDAAQYEPYLDLRKYGSAPHSGFGLGFERLVLFATGLDNIRDVIPFPRWPGNAAF